MLIEISQLRAGYGANTVIDIASLTIAKGEHTLLLGASGSGKTTLLNCLAGLTLPQSGQIAIDGQDITTLTASERDQFRGSRIGLVMQRLHLISALSVGNNLKLAQQLSGSAVAPERGRVTETLTSLGVADKANRYPRELSQGEAQRVAIARAVVNRPAIILADEPTAALDDTNCEAAITLLFTQATQYGATLLVATHDARIKPRFSRVVTLPFGGGAPT